MTETETEAVTESETVTGFTWSRRSSRTPDPGLRTPDSGTLTETETETVTESETVTGFTWSRWSSRTPDPGPRIPAPGSRTPGRLGHG